MVTRQQRRAYNRPGIRSGSPRSRGVARAAGLVQLAETQMTVGAFEHAADVLRGAVVWNPRPSRPRHLLARCLYRSGDFEAALAWLPQGVSTAEDETLRGQILADMNRWPDSLAAFGRALAADPGAQEARLRRASVRLSIGDPLGALPDLDTVIATDPHSTWARTLRASARIEAGLEGEALDDLDAIESDRRTAFHVLLQARAEILGGRADQLVDDTFAAGLKAHPSDPRLPIAFARHLLARRVADPLAAERAQEQLEGLMEDGRVTLPDKLKAEALFLLAEVLAEDPDGFERAESCFHAGLGLSADDPAGLVGLAALLMAQGRMAHALPWLIRACLVDPDRPRPVELLASALTAISDDEAAARWLGLLLTGLPQEAPRLLARLVRHVQEDGRSDAYEDVRRQAHRLKNRVAVLASRSRMGEDSEGLGQRLDALYEEWTRFLSTIRKIPPAPRLLSPAQILRRAIEQVAAEPAQVATRVPPGLPLIRGDEAQLVDALANILVNALQASPPGKPVQVTVRPSADLRWVEVAISDRGPGIDEADKRRIFELGFSRKTDGSGVGLSLARRALLSHGGRLNLASAPGGPTTFTVRLPVVANQAPMSMKPYETLALETLARQESQRAT